MDYSAILNQVVAALVPILIAAITAAAVQVARRYGIELKLDQAMLTDVLAARNVAAVEEDSAQDPEGWTSARKAAVAEAGTAQDAGLNPAEAKKAVSAAIGRSSDMGASSKPKAEPAKAAKPGKAKPTS